MGHVHVDVCIRGEKGERKLENVLVDTGATFTILPRKILEEIGAWGPQHTTTPLKLGDERKVEADIYSAIVKVGDREGPAIILTFKNAKTVLGVQSLEALGLKVNTTTGELESTRPEGIAYFY